jgi:hypothetical protein
VSNRSRPRTIFVEHDNLDMAAGGGDHYLAEYDYDRGSWVVDYGVAADLVSNWEHDRADRASVEGKGGVFSLAAVTPSGGADAAAWIPFAGVGSMGEYTLTSFPFKSAIEVTTPVPMRVTPVAQPTDALFAAFGKRVGVIFAGSLRWDNDTAQAVSEAAADLLGLDIGDQMNEETWLMWKSMVESAGFEMWDYEGGED